jgi:AcrR family transcriptional regulator
MCMPRGLRAEKQRRQRRAIIANTIALLRDPGADRPVRVRDIAARTGISEATFFNYFESKDAVLREWAEDVVEEALGRAADRLGEGAQLRRAVRALVDDLAGRIVAEGDLMRRGLELVRLVPCSAEPARGRDPRSDGALRLIEAGTSRGELRSDVAAGELAGTLRIAILGALLRGARADASAAAGMAHRARHAADVVLDGMRKRNERVRAPAVASRERPPAGQAPNPAAP